MRRASASHLTWQPMRHRRLPAADPRIDPTPLPTLAPRPAELPSGSASPSSSTQPSPSASPQRSTAPARGAATDAQTPGRRDRWTRIDRSAAGLEPARLASAGLGSHHPTVDLALIGQQLVCTEPDSKLRGCALGLSDACTRFCPISRARSPRIVPGTASLGAWHRSSSGHRRSRRGLREPSPPAAPR